MDKLADVARHHIISQEIVMAHKSGRMACKSPAHALTWFLALNEAFTAIKEQQAAICAAYKYGRVLVQDFWIPQLNSSPSSSY
ncbi:hypothetical protein F4824DRAFT_500960 [Ustulina deusta]|nr:hypothetical protein F4824DRAFT_500960 [Ustulina deusta]